VKAAAGVCQGSGESLPSASASWSVLPATVGERSDCCSAV